MNSFSTLQKAHRFSVTKIRS